MSEIYREICTHIKEADAILIGVSNGLSITEGLHLFADNTAFDMLFGDMKQKYGLHSIKHHLCVWLHRKRRRPM